MHTAGTSNNCWLQGAAGSPVFNPLHLPWMVIWPYLVIRRAQQQRDSPLALWPRRAARSFGGSFLRAVGLSPGPAELFSSVLSLGPSRCLTSKNVASLLGAAGVRAVSCSFGGKREDSLPTRRRHPSCAAIIPPSRQLGYFCPTQHSRCCQRKVYDQTVFLKVSEAEKVEGHALSSFLPLCKGISKVRSHIWGHCWFGGTRNLHSSIIFSGFEHCSLSYQFRSVHGQGSLSVCG